jgi:hypothetical protein
MNSFFLCFLLKQFRENDLVMISSFYQSQIWWFFQSQSCHVIDFNLKVQICWADMVWKDLTIPVDCGDQVTVIWVSVNLLMQNEIIFNLISLLLNWVCYVCYIILCKTDMTHVVTRNWLVIRQNDKLPYIHRLVKVYDKARQLVRWSKQIASCQTWKKYDFTL